MPKHVAEQHRQRFLAANLAGVNVADDQADQLARARSLGGRLDRRIGHDQERNRPPFRRTAQLGEIGVGRHLGELTAPRGHVVVPGGCAVVAPLGDRLQRVNSAFVRDLTHQRKSQCDQAEYVKHHRKSLAPKTRVRPSNNTVVGPRRFSGYQTIRPRPPNRGLPNLAVPRVLRFRLSALRLSSRSWAHHRELRAD